MEISVTNLYMGPQHFVNCSALLFLPCKTEKINSKTGDDNFVLINQRILLTVIKINARRKVKRIDFPSYCG